MLFGSDFGEQLSNLDVGTWSGPIESGYGLHLVRIDGREEGHLPSFEEAREHVRRDFANDRRLTMNEEFYDTLRKRYTVDITADTARQAPRLDEAQAPADTTQ